MEAVTISNGAADCRVACGWLAGGVCAPARLRAARMGLRRGPIESSRREPKEILASGRGGAAVARRRFAYSMPSPQVSMGKAFTHREGPYPRGAARQRAPCLPPIPGSAMYCTCTGVSMHGFAHRWWSPQWRGGRLCSKRAACSAWPNWYTRCRRSGGRARALRLRWLAAARHCVSSWCSQYWRD